VSAATLISCDTHLVPPPWLINELPVGLRDHVEPTLPRIEERDGRRFLSFVPAMQQLMHAWDLPSDDVEVGGDDELAQLLHQTFNVDPTASMSFGPEGRLEDLARDNVAAAVLITNVSIELNRDPRAAEAQVTYAQVVNDWVADTYKDHLRCFAPGILLPWLDPAACVTELERCAAKGMRPGLLPDAIWDAPYWQSQWEPLWEAANGLRIPLSFHVGGTSSSATSSVDAIVAMATEESCPGSAYEGFYTGSVMGGRTIMWFTLSGILQRYPDLQCVITECYGFWLAGLMQLTDHLYRSRFSTTQAASNPPQLDELPSAYIKRQCKVTFMWDPQAIRNRDVTGTDCLLWANDYPHPEGLFPNSMEHNAEQFAGVPEADMHKITFANGADLFGFDV
jgi:predicted TIM-barrel fold metal-dependent hydrolase